MNLSDRYPLKVSYYDEIELSTSVFVGNSIDKWIYTDNLHVMKVVSIARCNRSFNTSSPECSECKVRKLYNLAFLYDSTPFSSMCCKAIYDMNGRQYEMR